MTDEKIQDDQSDIYIDKEGIPYKSKDVWNANKKAEERAALIDDIKSGNAAADKNNNTSNKGTQKVKISDIDMPFVSMIVFMVKWAIASIPAILILMVLFFIFGGLLEILA